jgi:hypothetical protein
MFVVGKGTPDRPGLPLPITFPRHFPYTAVFTLGAAPHATAPRHEIHTGLSISAVAGVYVIHSV